MLISENLIQDQDSKLEASNDIEEEIAAEENKTEATEVAENNKEAEINLLDEDKNSNVATISSELSDLKNSSDELKTLEETIDEPKKKNKAKLASILKGIKAKTKNLNLKEIRQKGKLSESGKEIASEVFSKFGGKGNSKIKRKIKKLGTLQRRSYLREVYAFISDQWKLPVELSKDLETKVKLIIAKDGTLLEYSFVKYSKNKIFDQSIKSLFAELETLPSLPKDFEGKVTEIGLNFKPL